MATRRLDILKSCKSCQYAQPYISPHTMQGVKKEIISCRYSAPRYADSRGCEFYKRLKLKNYGY